MQHCTEMSFILLSPSTLGQNSPRRLARQARIQDQPRPPALEPVPGPGSKGAPCPPPPPPPLLLLRGAARGRAGEAGGTGAAARPAPRRRLSVESLFDWRLRQR